MTVVGCSRVEVSQDYPAGTDYSGISSYAWASDIQKKSGDVRVDSPLMVERIRTALDRSLSARGFLKKSRTEADVLVRYRFEIRQKIRSDDVSGGVGFGYGTGGRGGGIVFSSGADIQTYDEGLLAIDLLLADTEALIWRGYATFPAPTHSTPEETTARINEAVEKTLAQFPPAPQGG
jgi:hypothetical protein